MYVYIVAIVGLNSISFTGDLKWLYFFDIKNFEDHGIFANIPNIPLLFSWQIKSAQFIVFQKLLRYSHVNRSYTLE